MEVSKSFSIESLLARRPSVTKTTTDADINDVNDESPENHRHQRNDLDQGNDCVDGTSPLPARPSSNASESSRSSPRRHGQGQGHLFGRSNSIAESYSSEGEDGNEDDGRSSSSALIDCVDDEDEDDQRYGSCNSPGSTSATVRATTTGTMEVDVNPLSIGGFALDMQVRERLGLFRTAFHHQPNITSLAQRHHLNGPSARHPSLIHRPPSPTHHGPHPYPFHALNGLRHHLNPHHPGLQVLPPSSTSTVMHGAMNLDTRSQMQVSSPSSAISSGLASRFPPAPSSTSSPSSPSSNLLPVGTAAGGAVSAFHAPSSTTGAVLSGRHQPGGPMSSTPSPQGTMVTPTAADAALQRLAVQAQAAAVAAAAHQQHMHSLQLDWLARTGVYMPRLMDYNGNYNSMPQLIN